MAVQFTCNICSLENSIESLQALNPESSLCCHCRSNVRFRWIVHSLSTCFFGESLCLRDFPEARQIRGVGLSDAHIYAGGLAEKLSYTNTFYHCEPRFDIKDFEYGEPSSLDFIIASEVFEHVTPPVQPAFDNLARLLKPDGVILFSTPWRPSGVTEEHFPTLFDWAVLPFRDQHVLVNKTEAGELQAFTNLVFHGGPGETLEMRVFAYPDLMRNFQAAGLVPRLAAEPVPGYGIFYAAPWSLPCIVKKNVPQFAALASELDRLRSELAAVYAQATDVQQRVEELSRERDLVRSSKWLRLGNRLGLGPKLS